MVEWYDTHDGNSTKVKDVLDVYEHTCIHIHVYVVILNVHVYIYIYTCMCTHVHTRILLYTLQEKKGQ